MKDPLYDLRAVYQDRHARALDWKRSGRRVFGYFCDNIPEELLMAADILPVRVSGDPRRGRAAYARYVEPLGPFYEGRFDYVASMIEGLLSGEYDYLDGLVVPHTRKAIQQIYGQLLLIKEQHPALRLPELFFLDRTYTSSYSSALFNRRQIVAFRTALEKFVGHAISNDAIIAAIRLTNEARRLLRSLSDLRTASPTRCSGVDALHIIGASMLMPKASFVELLREFLAASGTEPVIPPRVRVFIGGSPFDHPQLYELIEAAGAVVVAEDHCWGARCGDFPVTEGIDPIEALAARYTDKPACSIALPLRRTVDLSVARALAARADAAIFLVQRGDELQLWETPDEVRALEATGMPVLHRARQPYAVTDSDRFAEEIGSFLAKVASAAQATEVHR